MTSRPPAYLIWPGIYLGTFYLAYELEAHGWNPISAITLVTFLLVLGLAIAERLAPLRRDWQVPDGRLRNDLAHLLIGFNLGTAAATWGAITGMAGCGAWINAHVGVWPVGWPMAAQLLLALVLGDLGNYWQHRLLHGTPALWRFHVVHHQPRRLALIKTTRLHALDIATGTFLELAPAVALGASIELVAWLTLFTNVSAVLQHVNVPLPTLPICDAIFSTPKNHRWHHARDPIPGNRNYSMNLMLCDLLFGSFYRASADTPDRVGVDGMDDSGSFWSQVSMPFRRRRPAVDPTA